MASEASLKVCLLCCWLTKSERSEPREYVCCAVGCSWCSLFQKKVSEASLKSMSYCWFSKCNKQSETTLNVCRTVGFVNAPSQASLRSMFKPKTNGAYFKVLALRRVKKNLLLLKNAFLRERADMLKKLTPKKNSS
jgi:hypothetical protein